MVPLRVRTDRKIKKIPLWMCLRGYLPTSLGGQPVYDSVVQYKWFDSNTELMAYLIQQLTVAIVWKRWKHMRAIAAHIRSTNI